MNVDPGYPHKENNPVVSISTMTYVYMAVGSVLSACLLGFVGYYTHSRWWYVEYMMARRQTKKVFQSNKSTHNLPGKTKIM